MKEDTNSKVRRAIAATLLVIALIFSVVWVTQNPTPEPLISSLTIAVSLITLNSGTNK